MHPSAVPLSGHERQMRLPSISRTGTVHLPPDRNTSTNPEGSQRGNQSVHHGTKKKEDEGFALLFTPLLRSFFWWLLSWSQRAPENHRKEM